MNNRGGLTLPILARSSLSPVRPAATSPAFAPVVVSERMELRAWRLFGADVAPLLDRVLAAQGETPDRELLSLQHSLADLLRLPANTSRSA